MKYKALAVLSSASFPSSLFVLIILSWFALVCGIISHFLVSLPLTFLFTLR